MATHTQLPYDAVLCDLDDVIRSYDHAQLHAIEAELGIPQGETAHRAWASPIERQLRLGQVDEAEWVTGVAAALTDRVPPPAARRASEALRAAPSRVDAEVVRLLQQARARVPLVLVTNGTRWLAKDLAALGLRDLVDHVVNSAAVGIAKPHDGIYRIAAERAQVHPGRCLFVDDQEQNVLAARTLGMTGVHYRAAHDLAAALAPLLAE